VLERNKKDVDARDKRGHDDCEVAPSSSEHAPINASVYSGFMLAAFTIGHHFSISAR
jgi:hypothetical protein